MRLQWEQLKDCRELEDYLCFARNKLLGLGKTTGFMDYADAIDRILRNVKLARLATEMEQMGLSYNGLYSHDNTET